MINWQFLRDQSDWSDFERAQYRSRRNKAYLWIGLISFGAVFVSFAFASYYNNIWIVVPTLISGGWMALVYAAKSSQSYSKPPEYPCWAARVNDEIINVTAEDIKPILYESEGWK